MPIKATTKRRKTARDRRRLAMQAEMIGDIRASITECDESKVVCMTHAQHMEALLVLRLVAYDFQTMPYSAWRPRSLTRLSALLKEIDG